MRLLFYLLLPYMSFAQNTRFLQRYEYMETLPPPTTQYINQAKICHCKNHKLLNADELANIFPFNNAKTVKIISFDNSGEGIELAQGEAVIPRRSLPKEEFILNQKQINKFADIFYNYGYMKKPASFSASRCIFVPRHEVIFYDSINQAIAKISVCFDCEEIEVYPKKVFKTEMCTEKIALIRRFFRSIGVTYHLY